MLSPTEYLKIGIPKTGELWLNGLDIVRHCLQKDNQQTFYKDLTPDSGIRHHEAWSEEMQNHVKSDDNFTEIYNNAYHPEKTWETFHDDSGAFDVGSFIAGEDFCFENETQIKKQKEALSILIDIGVSYGQRTEDFMIQRHKDVYNIIGQCDSEERPVQVVGVLPIIIPEITTPLKIFIMVKDYNDSIFPSIWGALKNNVACNDFVNVIMDYFIGTHEGCNGTLTTLQDANQYFQDNEELIIFGSRIKSNNANYRSI